MLAIDHVDMPTRPATKASVGLKVWSQDLGDDIESPNHRTTITFHVHCIEKNCT